MSVVLSVLCVWFGFGYLSWVLFSSFFFLFSLAAVCGLQALGPLVRVQA